MQPDNVLLEIIETGPDLVWRSTGLGGTPEALRFTTVKSTVVYTLPVTIEVIDSGEASLFAAVWDLALKRLIVFTYMLPSLA
jgi:hypothetical protein